MSLKNKLFHKHDWYLWEVYQKEHDQEEEHYRCRSCLKEEIHTIEIKYPISVDN